MKNNVQRWSGAGNGIGRGNLWENGFSAKENTYGRGDGDGEGTWTKGGSGQGSGRGGGTGTDYATGKSFSGDVLFSCKTCKASCQPEFKMITVLEDLKYCSEFYDD